MRLAILALAFLLGAATAVAAEPQPGKADEVIVIGALHRLHETEEGFGYAELERLIRTARADVLVLEVTPEELEGLTETRGRPEYPQVVWKLIEKDRAKAVAMEPGGALYKQMTTAAGDFFAAADKADPARARFAADYRKAYEASLLAYWRTAADTQDANTEALARGWYAVQDNLYGAEQKQLQDRWDGYMGDAAAKAVTDFPGKRILVLGSYRNRHRLQAAIRSAAPGRLVDTADWIRSRTPAAAN